MSSQLKSFAQLYEKERKSSDSVKMCYFDILKLNLLWIFFFYVTGFKFSLSCATCFVIKLAVASLPRGWWKSAGAGGCQ